MSCVHGPRNRFKIKPPDAEILVLHTDFEVKVAE